MEVILKQDINRLGKAGSVVKVKDGFARNFLIPNGLAIHKTSGSLKVLEQEKQKKILELEKARHAAEELKNKLDSLSLTIQASAQEEDKLYGSVGALEIAAALKEEGFEVDKNSIALAEPIKSLGIYEVRIELHPEVTAGIKVWIVRK
ncbi:MAG: 50S ribosomal protein L9 [Candidatus Omnitrophota bacterium]|jgi:large subunit ribosomal protein L9